MCLDDWPPAHLLWSSPSTRPGPDGAIEVRIVIRPIRLRPNHT